MSSWDAWLIVGSTVLIAIAAITGEYIWRRATGHWPPKGSGVGVAGTAAIIVANQDKDSKDDSGGDSSDSGGDSGGGD
jgi:hypothetical protein